MATSHFASGKKQHKKLILTSIAVGAAGVLGYFGWKFYKKRKQRSSDSGAYSDMDTFLPPASTSTATADTLPNTASNLLRPTRSKIPLAYNLPSAAITTEASDFPLKNGSKGEKVRLLQKALMAKYGKSILPKYGADGGFGSETVAALRKAGLPSVIDESTFNVLVQADGASLGTKLYEAVQGRDFSGAIAALKKMTSTADYTAANSAFKSHRLNGVRQTIVNALLKAFTADDEQQQIKFEFLRIGLQFDGSRWSLSGLGGLPIITIRPAIIWTNARDRVRVPARVVLGNEVAKRLDYTLFENQGQYYLVPTHCIRYF